MRFTLLSGGLLCLVSFSVQAEVAVQTDWSGGPGVSWPVIELGTQFSTSSGIEWLRFPGELSLSRMTWVQNPIDEDYPGASSLDCMDIDDDGDLDVAGCDSISSVVWWENLDGSGVEWTRHTIAAGFDSPRRVLAVDLDDDEDGDLIGTGDSWKKGYWVWLNEDGSGTEWSEIQLSAYWSFGNRVIRPCDMDGDGDPDVLGASWFNGIYWWENVDGTGASWVEHTATNFNYMLDACCEDVDSDGDEDLLVTSYDYWMTQWMENVDGTGTVWQPREIIDQLPFYSLSTADLDGDSSPDLIACGASVMTYMNRQQGIVWQPYNLQPEMQNPLFTRSFDLDCDGDQDIYGHDVNSTIAWWENPGSPGSPWEEHLVVNAAGGFSGVDCADLNGDGFADIACTCRDAGTVSWRGLAETVPSGYLGSSIFDTQMDPYWLWIDWTASEPAGTAVSFQVRASDDPEDLGDWSDTLSAPCALTGILEDCDHYLQYRVILESADPGSTPVLEDVTISWNPLGIGGGPEITESLLRGAEPNPSSGTVTLRFVVPGPSTVMLTVYDLAGRVVAGHQQGEYPGGAHQVQVSDLAPGIYLCRMVAGEYIGIQRFVVVD